MHLPSTLARGTRELNLNCILSFDYKLLLPKYNIRNNICSTESLYSMKSVLCVLTGIPYFWVYRPSMGAVCMQTSTPVYRYSRKGEKRYKVKNEMWERLHTQRMKNNLETNTYTKRGEGHKWN